MYIIQVLCVHYSSMLVWESELQLSIKNLHCPVGSKLYGFPVKDVPSWYSLPGEHVFNRAVREDRVPHIHIIDLPNKTLLDIEITHEIVWILTEEDLSPGGDAVTLPVNFSQAFPPVHEEGSCTWTWIPGDTEVGLQSAEVRDTEYNSASTQGKGISKHTYRKNKYLSEQYCGSLNSNFKSHCLCSSTEVCLPAVQLTPHVQLIIVLSPVRKEDDLAFSAELCGHSHAQSESLQVEGFQRDHLHITGTGLRGEDQGLDGNAPWETTNRQLEGYQEQQQHL